MIHGKRMVLCIVLAVLMALTLASGAFAAEDDVILDDASDEGEPYPDTYFTFPVNSDSVEATTVSLANPWTEASVEEIENTAGFALVVPDGVDVSSWYMAGMAEASWNWKGVEVTERISYSDAEPAMDTETLTELSGVYFTGMTTQSKELVVGGRCPGYMEFCQGDLGAVLWYDEEAGLVYTVSLDKTFAAEYLSDTAEWVCVSAPEKTKDEPLSEYWSADSAAAQQLRDYVKKVTDPEDTENFIPEKDRIAVFDMDGTLTCETYYTYYDTMMFIEYCLKDHPERVSDELKQIAASIQPGYTADETLARNFAKAYAGMTVEELHEYAVEFGQKYTASFHNMRYIDNAYLPMVELVQYLYENGFTIYVISGTERTTTRAIIANSSFGDYVTPNHVIGTDFEVKQAGYEAVSSNMDFKYENGDELVITGGFIQKNLNGNKSIYIEREIGQRPVLAFGNSGSDTSMMNYTIDSRNPYPAQAYMIVADDDVREWGTQNWEEKSADYIAKGFIPISMKNEFAQIYADGITKASEQYPERDEYLLDDAA